MDSKHCDLVSIYKKIEAQMNNRIHAETNTRTFTMAFGREMEAHLKKARIHRRLTTRWLNRQGLVNKDELAAISNRIIDCEEKIDLLDDSIYHLNKILKENYIQLRMVRESWDEWFIFLKDEVRAIHDDNVNTLEKELQELKLLFHNEFDLEESDND
ncbi:hypothetical protein BABA_12086 [Neobacillus bataviensis LMG 21833]|uniref:Uncharacterized protein n=1 Tax=Neobacillus bataviensis LMG 21833 TaxID=1117379 RepID=K6CCC0_9BACI|nr:hypothetical protein [Neobacillus bataviensis]EKN68790.1 hypothetical protein BABA_12086 [Neobacillus bataviensis LMG 21833]